MDIAEKMRKPIVELPESSSVAGEIASMSEEHVEIDQIGEDQALS